MQIPPVLICAFSPRLLRLPGRIHKARTNDLTLLGAIALRDPLCDRSARIGFYGVHTESVVLNKIGVEKKTRMAAF